MLEYTWTNWTNAASGLLFVLLGLIVARLGRKERANASFALLAIAYGSAMLLWNLGTNGAVGTVPASAAEALVFVTISLLFIVTLVGIGLLALSFPTRPGPRERGYIVVAAATGGGTASGLVLALYVIPRVLSPPAEGPILPFVPTLSIASYSLLMGGFLGACMLFAFRFRDATQAEASAYAIVASALVLQPAFFSGLLVATILADPANAALPLWRWLAAAIPTLGPTLALTVLWLHRSARAREPRQARLARAAAWVGAGGLSAGAIALLSAPPSGDHWGYGLARTAGVVVLAYAIVRGQLPGIDVKVRFALSRSTIAAVFIAAFFVASETAQQFFGDTLGSTYVGIAAAGMLVFAMAPLQRVAERMAALAVPATDAASASAPDATPRPPASREALYRDAVAYALRDGLTRREEAHLAHLAQELGIGAADALRIRHEVEDEPTTHG